MIPLTQQNKEWSGWWSKVNIFNGQFYMNHMDKNKNELLVFYIDLDMIITGNLDGLINAY